MGIETSKRQIENPGLILKKNLAHISRKSNAEILQGYKKNNLLEADGSLSMDSFLIENGGIYTEAEIRADKEEVRRRELIFAEVRQTEDTRVQEAAITKWKENKIRRKGTHAEMMVTILLNKVLGDEFLVMRTATYDDYVAGTDFIIVNKKTGKTICALDSLADTEEKIKDGELPLVTKKADKIMHIAESGGADIKYGVKIKGDQMILEPLKNMPIFYFDISDEDYGNLLESNSTLENKITKKELKIFYAFIRSLQEQRESLLLADKLKPNDPVMQKILAFQEETLNSFIAVYHKRREALSTS